MMFPPFSPFPYSRRSFGYTNNTGYMHPAKKYSDSKPNFNDIKNISSDNNEKNLPALKTDENSENYRNSDYDSSFFEIFGLKLYFDDILLICMIFFLYSEGVEDQMLFIALILLLIS